MIDIKILEKYLEGKGTNQDKKAIIEWFLSLSDEQSLRKISFPIWDKPDKKSLMPEDKAESLLDRIHHLIRLQEIPAGKKSRTIMRYINILSRIAAVLFIPLVIVLWTLRDHFYTSGNGIVYSEIVCPPGTRTMFYLPDGSKGWLNGGSSIEFPVEFKGKTREVRLSGEAFFELESAPRRPFIVSLDHIRVKAYGTTFNVMSYPSEKMIEVTLVEGGIDVLREKDGVVKKLESLDPGEMFSYDPGSFTCKIKNADVEKTISWKNGKLIFRDDSFKEVVRKCNRWYNVEMIIKDKALESYTYVGTFQDETLDEFLKLLLLTAPIEYKDLGRKLNEDGTFEKRKIEIRYKRNITNHKQN